jgi:hypothetical protein
LDTFGLDQAQCKLRIAHAHREWLTPAGAASQQLHRFPGNKAQFTQALRSGVSHRIGTSYQTRDSGVRAAGQVRQQLQIGHGRSDEKRKSK